MNPASRLARGAAAATAVFVMVSGLTGVAAAAPSGGEARTAEELPALESPPDGPRNVSNPEGDFSNAPPTASERGKRPAKKKSFDPERSVLKADETTPTKAVYANPDKSETAILNTGPVRFRDDAGAWRDIILDLVERQDGSLGAESAPPGHVTLARGADGHVVAGGGPQELRFRHVDARPVQAARSGHVARYKEAMGTGRDLEIELLSGGFKENVVISSKSASPTYQVEVVLPGGASVRPTAAGAEFVDNQGAVIGTFGGGYAFDAKTPPAKTTVATTIRAVAGAVATLEVAIDPGWLAAPDRVFPVTVDPVFYQNTSFTNGVAVASDTYVDEDFPTTNFGSSSTLEVGSWDGWQEIKALLMFSLGSLPRNDRWVSEAHLSIFNKDSAACQPADLDVLGPAAWWHTYEVNWNNQPPVYADPVSTGKFAHGYDASCPGAWENLDVTTLASSWVTDLAPNNGIELSAPEAVEYNPITWKAFHSGETGSNSAPALYITYNTLPPPTTAVQPPDGQVLFRDNPTFVVNPVADVDNDPVQYWFKVATAPDGESGAVVAQSGWISSTSWTPPSGSLKDGATYYWRVWTYDGTIWRDPGWVRKVSINRRLGTAPASPTDSVGPATVNLATGNVVVSTSSPSFAAVGGSSGLAYTYNSDNVINRGVTGTYWHDLNRNRVFDESTSMLTRVDSSISFDWVGGSPAAALPADDLLVRWTGYVTVPATGAWRFGAASDDGVRVWVNNVLHTDRWVDQGAGTVNYGGGGSVASAPTLNQGTRYPIKVEYYENRGAALVRLHATGPGATDVIVPADWLSPADGPLSDGWELSAGDDDIVYTAARIADRNVTLLEPDGTGHGFRWNGADWVPPDGEDGVLVQNGDGTFTFADVDGRVSTFSTDGTLQRVVSGTDDRKPAALSYSWSTSGRLTEIVDPVSARKHRLSYGGDPLVDGGPACPTASETPSGFDGPASNNRLCRIRWWDDTVTNFFYSSGRLARIVDPGGEVTDFAYVGGRLAKARDPLAADAVAAGRAADDDTSRTLISYDAGGRASSVTLPAPTSGAARPRHWYEIGIQAADGVNWDTKVHVDGITESPSRPFARKVTFDPPGRLITDIDGMGSTTSQVWKNNSTDVVISSTDPAGRKSTTLYDHADRPTNAYGPAPAGSFNSDGTPTAAAAPSVPHTTTTYDGGVNGLAATYWDNKAFGGPPKRFGTGVGAADGTMVRNWGTAAPATDVPSDGWSGRFSGDVSFLTGGTYTFDVDAADDDGVRLFVDNKQVVDAWSARSGADAASWGANRIDLFARGTNNALEHMWWDGVVWSKWENLGGVLTSDPGAVSWGPGRIDVFARGTDNALWHAWFDNAGWHDWESLGGILTGGPDAASWGPNHLAVFGRGVDNKIWTRSWNGSAWSAWSDLPGSENLKGDPSATSWGPGRIDVFARGSGDQLAQKVFDGTTWQPSAGTGWYNLGGILTSSPATSSWGPNRLDVFVRGNDNAVWHNAYSGAWSGFQGRGGSITTDPAAVSWGSGRIDVFAQGLGNDFHQLTFANNAWNNWPKLIRNARVGTFTAEAGKTYRVRLDTYDETGEARIGLRWMPPGFGLENVPGGRIKPRYGLVTSSTTLDTQAGHLTTTTSYARPELGLATAVTQGGPTTQTGYEDTGGSLAGWARRTSRTLPAGNTTTYAYYDDSQFVANPCNTASTANQAGMLKTATSPARVEESVYDSAGRVLATRIGTGAWGCTTYDSRGRVATKSIPAWGAEPARTVIWNHAVGGDPLVTSVTDAAGTVTTTVDLLGRTVSYTDVWGKTTTTTYDQAGRSTDTSGPAGALHVDYDQAGRVATQKLDGATVAVPTYNGAGEMTSVSYPTGAGNGGNNTALDVTRDDVGRVVSHTAKTGGSPMATDVVARSQSGRVRTDTVDGATTTYGYDAAGRLTSAASPGRSLTYEFAESGGCGSLATAGKNTNRTRLVDNGVATTYCYDSADRLTSTSDPRYGALAYDAHGNTTTLGAQTLGYDGADRHVSTVSGDTSVRYVRDATDRIVAREAKSVATIAYRAASTATNGAGATTLVIPRPAGLQAGDVVLAQISAAGGATPAITPAPGFSTVNVTANSTLVTQGIYYRQVTDPAAEPASYSFGLGAVPRQASGAAVAYSGVDPSAPIHMSAVATSPAGTTHTAPSVTTTVDGAMAVAFYGLSSPTSVTPPSGMAERTDVNSGAVGTTAEAADELRPTKGAVGSRVATSAASAASVDHLVTLAPQPIAGPGPITLRGSATAANGAGATSVTVSRPAAVQAGDVMVAQVSVAGGSSVTITPPAGWTPINVTANATLVLQGLYYRQVTNPATEPTSYSFGFGALPRQATAAVIAYGGVDLAPGLQWSAGTNGAGTSHTAPGLTTTREGSQLVAFYGLSSSTTMSPPSGMTERVDRNSGTAAGTTSGAADELRAAKGATGSRVATSALAAASVAQMVALPAKLTAPTVTRYGYSGGGDASDFVTDATGVVVERTIPLVGGVLLTKRATGDVWSYPNVHGDVMAVANASGAKQGPTLTYDAYGNALSGLPDNSADDFDYGWLGQHQRGLEHLGPIDTIEMGARQYVPGLGRFLEVDPVEGGSANDYEYAFGDCVNGSDLDGRDARVGKCGVSYIYATAVSPGRIRIAFGFRSHLRMVRYSYRITVITPGGRDTGATRNIRGRGGLFFRRSWTGTRETIVVGDVIVALHLTTVSATGRRCVSLLPTDGLSVGKGSSAG